MEATDRAELLRSSTTYRRWRLGPGVACWVYEYRSSRLLDHHGMATGLEVAVQVEGPWLHEGSALGKGLFEAGMIHRINSGEGFRASYAAVGGTGVQVGFEVHPTEAAELRGVTGELCFRGDAGAADPALHDLCRWLVAHSSLDAAGERDVRSAIVAYVERHAVIAPVDPLLAAKRELESYSDCELRVAHIAETAKMHPVTFARNFKKRFGATPAHYRLHWRLHRAARLLWSQPTARVADIAGECGFRHMSFFHGLFRSRFGMAPAEWRRDRAPA